mgnify:CR=1 FL=1
MAVAVTIPARDGAKPGDVTNRRQLPWQHRDSLRPTQTMAVSEAPLLSLDLPDPENEAISTVEFLARLEEEIGRAHV